MKKTIIIIENNKTTFEHLKEHVKSLGSVDITYDEIDVALKDISGQDNISKLVQRKIRKHGKNIVAFIVDLQLQKNNNYGGIQIIKDIRNISSVKKDKDYWRLLVPIIVCTNYPNYAETAVDAGANCVIQKDHVLEMEDDAINQKKTWEDKLNDFITDKFIPVVKSYCDWYLTTMRKIDDVPISVKEASITFFKKNNDPKVKHAFVMTSFSKDYEKAIKIALDSVEKRFYVKTHIANTTPGETDEGLYNNLCGLMHCCDFGIGIYFPDPKTGNVNANLSVEVGYMLGLGKRICYLKDVNLEQLNTDLISKIYTEYKKTKKAKGKDVLVMEEALISWIDSAKNDLKIQQRK